MAETFGLIANVCQVVDLFVKVGVMCSIYCMDVKNAPQDVRRILNQADRMTATLKEVERLMAGPNAARLESSPTLHQSVLDCRILLSELAAKLDYGARLSRAVWPFNKRDVKSMIAKMEGHQRMIELELNIKQTTLLLDVHQEIVLSKLRVVDGATFDSSMDGDEATCLPGTRLEVLQQINEWAHCNESESVFWLNGMAGTGKSTISRTVAQSLTDEGRLGASFFFKRGEGDRGRAAFFLATLSAQLVRKLPAMAAYVRTELENDPAIHEKAMGHQFDKLILTPLQKATANLQRSTLIVVIDALDECDREDNMRTIVRILSQAQSSKAFHLKFFLTSRPELPIRLGFEEIRGKYDGLLLLQIPHQVISNDITCYVWHQLDIIRKDYNMSVTSNRKLAEDWPGAENAQKLVEMAIPLFIAAATICRFISDRRLGGPHNQLARILEQDGARSSHFEMTYLPVLSRLQAGLSTSEREMVMQGFKATVGSILTLAQPLSIQGLSGLLDVPTDDIEDQLDLLHSVLKVPSDTRTPIRVLHLSFRDFILDPEKGKNLERYPFWVDEKATHARLALQCLELLSKEGNLKEDMCCLQAPGTMRSDIAQELIESSILPEIQYACIYWVHHLREGKYTIQDDDATHVFLRTKLLFWLEALTLLGRISEALGMVNSLLTLLDSTAGQQVANLVHDTRRVLLANVSIIDRAPLQIYSSVLIFSPEKSLVRKQFTNHFPSWISRLPQVNMDWDPCLMTLEGNERRVHNVRVTSGGDKIISEASSIKIWDITTAACLLTIEKEMRELSGNLYFQVSPCGTNFLSALDNILQLRDIRSGDCTSMFRGHSNDITLAVHSYDGKYIASASRDSILKIWNVETCHCVASFEVEKGGVRHIRFSRNGMKIMSISSDFTLDVWDIIGGKHIATCAALTSVDSKFYGFSLNSQKIALRSDLSTIQVWDIGQNEFVMIPVPKPEAYDLVIFSPDGNHLSCVTPRDSATNVQYMSVWDVSTGAQTASIAGHSEVITSICYSPDGTIIASASHDNTIKLWNAHNGDCLSTLHGHNNAIQSIAFSKDGSSIISASDDWTIKVWDINTGTYAGNSDMMSGTPLWVMFSPDQSRIVSAASDWSLNICDASGRYIAKEELHEPLEWVPLVYRIPQSATHFQHSASVNGHISWPRSAVFSSNGVCFTNRRIWNVDTGDYIKTAPLHRAPLRSITSSYDGEKLVSGFEGGAVAVWSATDGKPISTYNYTDTRRFNDHVCASFSSDGMRIVTTWMPDSVCLRIWDISSDVCVATYGDTNEGIRKVAFSPDGSKVLSVSDQNIRIWNTSTGDYSNLYETDVKLTVHALDFSPDSTKLAVAETLKSTGHKQRLVVWDMVTGNCIYKVGIGRLVNHLRFDAGGLRIHTNVGSFVLGQCMSQYSGDSATDTNSLVKREGIGLSTDGEWILRDSEKLLWLPYSHRPSATDVAGSHIALGTNLGRITSIGIR